MDIHLTSLTFSYPGQSSPVIQDLTLSIPAGQFVAIIGQSGCGKSTLLHLIAGLLPPTSGSIHLNGDTPAHRLQTAQSLGWMAQSPALLPWLTARQNVALVMHFLRNGSQPLMTPDQALQRVGLAGVAEEYPLRLSGGMQQRLALARLLVQGAAIWLMDEPFSALDELTREQLSATLLELWQWLHPTVLWVTHHIYEAVRLADRILVLSPRPARVLDDLTISLPRPRDERQTEFQGYVHRLRETLFAAKSSSR